MSGQPSELDHYRHLMDQDFGPLHTAIASWRDLAEACTEAQNRSLREATAPLTEAGWEGQAATYGFRAMGVTQSILATANRNVALITGLMEHAEERMLAAQRRLRNAVAQAEEAGHRVTENGWVEAREIDPAYRNDPDYQLAQRDANTGLGLYRAEIARALADAAEASGSAAQAMRQLDWFYLDKEYGAQETGELADWIADEVGIGVAEDEIPADRSPAENATWWAALGEGERFLLLASYPAEIGALDGLPAEIRDQANRSALDAQINEFAGNENDLGHHDSYIYSDLLRLRETLSEHADAPAGDRLYLLGFGTQDDGRAIVARGNPDTAAHTAIMVPGTNTDLSSVPGQIRRIDTMRDESLELTGDGNVSVISWLDYDAPEIAPSVLGTGRAREAADDLRDFTAGLRAARDGEGPGHLTVVGHSYGSTAVGAADAGGNGLGADDIIALGSPGLSVDEAADLHVDPRHLWIGAAEDDLIANHASGLTLGADPAAEGFGAQEMPVDTSGHSGYWHDESNSLANISRIIAGRPPLPGYEE